ncbi:MAG: DUF5916 domain-containing protein [Acidobacteriota bacterium]
MRAFRFERPAGRWPTQANCAHLTMMIVGWAFAQQTLASTNASTVHSVPRTQLPIVVDGHVDEAAWQQAASIALAYETRPGENIAAPAQTECLITYDDHRLYVAFKAQDPEPDKIRARLADRDSVFSDDWVGIVLDTFNDQRRAFEFFVNPLGVQIDLTYDDVNEDEDSSWDAIWSSAGRLTETGFVVELSVPFSSLRFPQIEGEQTWGVDLLRAMPRSVWHRMSNNPQDRNVNCYVCQFSKLTGFSGITPGRNLEITPTLTGGVIQERAAFPDGPLETGEEVTDLGLTVSWGVTPNLNLSATLNPDFSQVEADAAQLEINNQFALFFPERRPFFLEDADLFSTRLNTVFTRNVADPAWGLRATGKAGKNAFGVFVAQDELTNLVFPGSQGSEADSFDFETSDSVLRYRRDLPGNSALGALITHRSGDGYSNLLGGFDGLIRFSESDSLEFQVLRSETEYPSSIAAAFDQPSGSFSDEALSAAYIHNDRRWRWWAVYEDVGDDFRADMGFIPRVGFRHYRSGAIRTWWGEADDWHTQFRVGGVGDRVEDQSGQRLEQTFQTWVSVNGPRQSFAELELVSRERFFNGVDFEETQAEVEFEIQPTSRLELELEVLFGDQVDFANTQLGEVLSVESEARLDFGRHLRTFLSHEFRRLDVDGGTLFEANLSQARLLYQFNLRTFLRAIVQRTDIQRETALFREAVEARTQRLFTQLLFSYKLNPRTVLFLGYSDNYRGDQQIALTQENRALFLKLGYAWVL